RASFPFGSQQQANEALRRGLPTSRLMDYDISAGFFYPSRRFHRLGQSLRRHQRQSSPTAFQSRHDAQKRIWSTRFRRSISASTLIPDRFTLAIVISGEKTE